MDRKSVKPLEELLDSVRDIEGFPIAEDEDILALSDPPFYTACPNPYINEFINEHGSFYDPDTDNYDIKPFIGDIKENKRDALSNAHYYVTKVPFKAIIYFILHYTKPGEIIFDGFCGSGMTGLAGQISENPPKDLKKRILQRIKNPKFGKRHVILNEISPFASFISWNYNFKVNKIDFEKKGHEIIKSSIEECAWMFETNHITKENEIGAKSIIKGTINHVFWSDVFICPYCKNEYVFWDLAMDFKGKQLKDEYLCDSCNTVIKKNACKSVKVTVYDDYIGKEVEIIKQVPVLINYSIGNKKFEKRPDENDIQIIEMINNQEIPYWFPKNELPLGYNTDQPKKAQGFTHVHHFYSKRNLWILSKIFDEIKKIDQIEIRNKFLFLMTSLLLRSSKNAILQVSNYFNGGGGYITTISSNLYIPSIHAEVPVINQFKHRLKKINKINAEELIKENNCIVSTNSSTNLKLIPENSIDYIFIDPPFGANLMYSELNFIPESWLKVIENDNNEAIINTTKNKDLNDYGNLMTKCLKEMNRILKPNRWMTIEFHNSKASVWNSIQESLTRAGFIIAQVGVLDKQQGSFISHVSPGAVENDLIINAYKPSQNFVERFIKKSGDGMEVDFVKEQLNHLPITANIERTEKMLYSKILSHYVENGFKVRYNASNFYQLLAENFIELDGYWFLSNQVNEYNHWKSRLGLDQLKEILDGQQILFVTDEKSALTWIYHFLNEPKDYNSIYTAYQQIATKSTDKIPELRDILDNNFILEEGNYRRPLNQEEREKVIKIRESELNRVFNKLLERAKTKKGTIKEIRREALVHGFTKCYQQGRYEDILIIADKLSKNARESSGDILDFIDIARIKTSGKEEL